jgi:hypothetical protein
MSVDSRIQALLVLSIHSEVPCRVDIPRTCPLALRLRPTRDDWDLSDTTADIALTDGSSKRAVLLLTEVALSPLWHRSTLPGATHKANMHQTSRQRQLR